MATSALEAWRRKITVTSAAFGNNALIYHDELVIAELTDWAEQRVLSGLSSGEGVIYHVRDPQRRSRRVLRT